MGWGQARRPKISSKLGSPNPREGSDGDIQVRQTSMGARLFAKLGGRWLSNKLYGNELDDPDTSILKCWVYNGTFPKFSDGGAALNFTVSLPDHIPHENVVSFSLMSRGVSFGARVGFALCGDIDDENPSTVAGTYELTALWETDRRSFYIQGQTSTTGLEEEVFILTVFFR